MFFMPIPLLCFLYVFPKISILMMPQVLLLYQPRPFHLIYLDYLWSNAMNTIPFLPSSDSSSSSLDESFPVLVKKIFFFKYFSLFDSILWLELCWILFLNKHFTSKWPNLPQLKRFNGSFPLYLHVPIFNPLTKFSVSSLDYSFKLEVREETSSYFFDSFVKHWMQPLSA